MCSSLFSRTVSISDAPGQRGTIISRETFVFPLGPASQDSSFSCRWEGKNAMACIAVLADVG